MSDVFYKVKGLPSEVGGQNPDGTFWSTTDPDEIARIVAEDEAKAEAEVARKGHDCWDNPVHSLFRSSRGGMQDAYNCGICGELLQVG